MDFYGYAADEICNLFKEDGVECSRSGVLEKIRKYSREEVERFIDAANRFGALAICECVWAK